jgi:2-amino-4-hydroxy-6-hydroxymethyldihydropteridine diphosphokinase
VILAALGSNLPSAWGSPRETLEEAMRRLERSGVRVVARSRYFDTAPVPPSGQPRFVNAVVHVETARDPTDLLHLLHAIEAEAGRARGALNAARTLDLDLLDYDGRQHAADPVLPHPRLHLRGFVLLPLADVAPGWIHPILKVPVETLIARLPPGEDVRPL